MTITTTPNLNNAVLERLHREVSGIISQTDWANIAKASALLNNFSPRNAVLISIQSKDRGTPVSHLCGYKNWQKLGRSIKVGEKGYSILAPIFEAKSKPQNPTSMAERYEELAEDEPKKVTRFRWVTIFDVSQTVGAEITPPAPQLLTMVAKQAPELVILLSRAIANRGFEVIYSHLEGANGLSDFKLRQVVIHHELPPTQRAKTLAHELSHIILHQKGVRSRAIAEIEAETTAFIVMSNFGIDSDDYSFAYIASWSNGDLYSVISVAERSQSAAREITAELVGSNEYPHQDY